MTGSKVSHIVKRNGLKMPFDKGKIADAIFKAAQSVGGQDRHLAADLAEAVSVFIHSQFRYKVPSVEDIQDVVEKVLIETGHARTAKAYILYRNQRQKLRQYLKVHKGDPGLFHSNTSEDWDKNKITAALQGQLQLSSELSEQIASAVEGKVFQLELLYASTDLIWELIKHELVIRGMWDNAKKLASRLGQAASEPTVPIIPQDFPLEQKLLIQNNDLSIVSLGSDKVVSEYIWLNHLKGLSDSPWTDARALTEQWMMELRRMAPCVGQKIIVPHMNTFYAPFLEGMSYDNIKKEAQHILGQLKEFCLLEQGAIQTILQIETHVSAHLEDTVPLMAGGQYAGRPYGQHQDIMQLFAIALLDMWKQDKGLNKNKLKLQVLIEPQGLHQKEQGEMIKIALSNAMIDLGVIPIVFAHGDTKKQDELVFKQVAINVMHALLEDAQGKDKKIKAWLKDKIKWAKQILEQNWPAYEKEHGSRKRPSQEVRGLITLHGLYHCFKTGELTCGQLEKIIEECQALIAAENNLGKPYRLRLSLSLDENIAQSVVREDLQQYEQTKAWLAQEGVSYYLDHVNMQEEWRRQAQSIKEWAELMLAHGFDLPLCLFPQKVWQDAEDVFGAIAHWKPFEVTNCDVQEMLL